MSSSSARLKLLATLAAVVMVVAACGSDPENTDGEAGGDSEPEGGGTELLVEAHDFRFEVAGATLGEPGEDVTVRLVNQGQAPHTFSSDDVDLDVTADPGGEGEGAFTVPESGTVAFQCNIHPDQMKITLTSGEEVTSDTGSGESESESEGESTADDDYDY